MEAGVLKAVQSVHQMIDKEVAAGVSANHIFLCGFSQGGRSSHHFLMECWEIRDNPLFRWLPLWVAGFLFTIIKMIDSKRFRGIMNLEKPCWSFISLFRTLYWLSGVLHFYRSVLTIRCCSWFFELLIIPEERIRKFACRQLQRFFMLSLFKLATR